MEIGKEALRIHNKEMIELIKQSPEYKKREQIRRLYENLMNKIEPLKEKNIDEYKRKRELYTNQYLTAEGVFLNKIMERNEKCWPKIKEEACIRKEVK
jgi:hypothetical protein